MRYSIERQTTNPNDSDVSTSDTIARMCTIVRKQVYSPIVIQALADAIKDLPVNANTRAKARAIFYWIKDHVKFRNDFDNTRAYLPSLKHPEDKELLISPDLLLQLAYGDCDDFAMLAVTMLCIAGIPGRFVTIAADDNAVGHYSHVYAQAYDREINRWFGFDVSHGSMPGWEYQQATRMQVWHV